MKAKEIQELIDFISNSGLAEVKIETDEFKLSIKKNAETQVVKAAETAPSPAPSPAPAPASAPAPAASPAPEKEAPAADASNYVEIKSPMIGTFYTTPNPDADNFVSVGDSVKPGQTVCIIEAMKLFNEIESEVSGKIVKVLVENATPVEYDQPLFLVDPAG
ncbi:acetyl-CoA carboxylase biotin carboxyl carrier protein [Echinicola vietnamensis]|uniref:Biotin carboxyl carrier protein of acetyl-CoA carboxylase n=1 Tax=Echinicola vietnamensis (strain DSM 17526 / LMG 23754 / KMM 6221) TaxID=926556 RepID=L0FT70_ECHVK|nr:acetyl-CoA carboxylase biotin carboxyl carrier protein [Echinicola vietnamensis]AGA76487.1 acetyl-CoA carboxylase, biotin carboxyl carrier protein [Echinicola vietnamensis DSM 17526]